MRTDERDEALADELRALARSITVPPPDDRVIEAALVRVAKEPVPGAPTVPRRVLDWLRARRKAAAATLAGVLIALALTPPVRATVLEWFGFGGVIVREAPVPGPSSAPPPPAVRSGVSLPRARELAGFTLMVPAELPTPDGVEVSADRRMVSMSWADTPTGTVRLDQFDGRLAPMMGKFAQRHTRLDLDGDPALWFEEPHGVVVLHPDGSERFETARLAGNTLIWQRDGITLRLEGDLDRQRAVAFARSVR